MSNNKEYRILLDSCVNNKHTCIGKVRCYNCLYKFNSSEIYSWKCSNSAKCPKCFCESVLPNSTDEQMIKMCIKWRGIDEYNKIKKNNMIRRLKIIKTNVDKKRKYLDKIIS